MNAFLFLSLCAYQFFLARLLLLVLCTYSSFVISFFLSPNTRSMPSIVLSRKTELFLFCILSSKSLYLSRGYQGANAHANWNKSNKYERHELPESSLTPRTRLYTFSNRLKGNETHNLYLSLSFAEHRMMSGASCVLLVPLNSAERLNLVAGTAKP